MQYCLNPGVWCLLFLYSCKSAKNEPSEYQNILYMCIEGEPTISEYSVYMCTVGVPTISDYSIYVYRG